MREALREAEKAKKIGEVPVGAVIVKEGLIVSRAHNLTETLADPTAHAEILAIREAAKVTGNSRLTGCDMYVTLEPCCMCAGALVWSRVEKLVIGTEDPKAGGCGSVFNIVESEELNHRIEVKRGILRDECSGIITDFFRELRNRKKKNTGGKR